MNAHETDAWADAQVQSGMAFLSAEAALEWEAARAAREAKARQRIADWRYHADQCDRRGNEYAVMAARFPAAHKDRHYYLKLANEQFTKAAYAERQIEIEQEQMP